MTRIKLYRPSNGTEGEMFEAAWCQRCRKAGRCNITFGAMLFGVEDPGYPREWRYVDNKPPGPAFVDADTPRAPRTHKPSVDQLHLFDTRDQSIDWHRCGVAADVMEERGDEAGAEKVREMVQRGDVKVVKIVEGVLG